MNKKSLRYVCDKCCCKKCVKKLSGECTPCMFCGNNPKEWCALLRVFDPKLKESAKLVKVFKNGDNVEWGALESALGRMLEMYESIEHFIEAERFVGKLVYDMTVEIEPPKKGR